MKDNVFLKKNSKLSQYIPVPSSLLVEGDSKRKKSAERKKRILKTIFCED